MNTFLHTYRLRAVLCCAALLLAGLLSACDLLEENPKGFVSPGGFYTSVENVNLALNGVYKMMAGRLYTRGMYFAVQFPTDNDQARAGHPNAEFVALSNGTYGPSNSRIGDVYEYSYLAIARANTIITRLEDNENFSDEVRGQLMGEAKVLRAFNYFNLVRLFGDVVLVTEAVTSLSGDLVKPRTDAVTVYAQIIQDLKDAAEGLPAQPRQLGRPDKWAAKALLAKVYMTMAGEPINDDSKWALAKDVILEVVNNGSAYHGLVDDYSAIYDVETLDYYETLFALDYSRASGGTVSAFVKRNLPQTVDGWATFWPHEDLLKEYAANDLRGDFYLDSVMYEGEMVDIDPKRTMKLIDMVALQAASRGETRVMLLRWADVLLMAAEIINEVDGPAQAYTYVNKVRRRAGLQDLQPGLSQAAFREAVWRERRLELAHEYNRWFDLKRQGRYIEVAGSLPGNQVENFPYKTLFPIPQEALDTNPKLTQNPGYGS